MKPSSRVKIRACRLNGALSRGPVTEAGKRRSAANGLYHGLYSKQVVLPGESQKAFDQLISRYVESQQPRDHRELALVKEIAVIHWRLHRLLRLEKDITDAGVPPQHYAWADPLPEPLPLTDAPLDLEALTIESDAEDRLIEALQELYSQRELPTLMNHQFRLSNCYHRAVRRLLDCRRNKKSPIEPT